MNIEIESDLVHLIANLNYLKSSQIKAFIRSILKREILKYKKQLGKIK